MVVLSRPVQLCLELGIVTLLPCHEAHHVLHDPLQLVRQVQIAAHLSCTESLPQLYLYLSQGDDLLPAPGHPPG